jgi:hypothetical protein
MKKLEIADGETIGILTAIRDAGLKKVGKVFRTSTLFLCKCGKETVITNSDARSGKIKSCGCLRVGPPKKHGHAATYNPSIEYRTWSAMIGRCSESSRGKKGGKRYVDRGIIVCERWKDFENFLADMGPRLSVQNSIDRFPDQDGNYEPGNCRWATSIQQANNTSANVCLTFYGKTMTLTEWSRISLVHSNTIRMRLRKGWSEKLAVWTPTMVGRFQKGNRSKRWAPLST